LLRILRFRFQDSVVVLTFPIYADLDIINWCCWQLLKFLVSQISRCLLFKLKAWFLWVLYTAKTLGFCGCHLGHIEKLHTMLKYRTIGSDLTPNDKYEMANIDNWFLTMNQIPLLYMSLEKRWKVTKGQIKEFLKWSHRPAQIVFIIESRMGSTLWAHSLVSSQHMSFCESIVNYKPCGILLKYRSSTRRVTTLSSNTLVSFHCILKIRTLMCTIPLQDVENKTCMLSSCFWKFLEYFNLKNMDFKNAKNSFSYLIFSLS